MATYPHQSPAHVKSAIDFFMSVHTQKGICDIHYIPTPHVHTYIKNSYTYMAGDIGCAAQSIKARDFNTQPAGYKKWCIFHCL